MRETVGDWKKEWIETNGETNDLEVLVSFNNSDEYIFEGSFKDIPVELENRKVVQCGRILTSSVPNRIGAFCLQII